MAMDLRMTPKMSQQLRMTPQLRQAIKLLQLSRMELITTIREEMVQNPVLEEAQDTLSYDLDDPNRRDDEAQAPLQGSPEDMGVPEVQANESDMQSVDWEAFVDHFSSSSMPSNSYQGMQGDDMPGLDQTLSSSPSLVDHLLEQVRLSVLEEHEYYTALLIIGSLDEDGYLVGMTVEEIAQEANVTVDDVDDVLVVIQDFEPLGVAARDLRECLLLQLEKLHPSHKLARRLVKEFIPDLERKSYSKIARSLGIEQQEVIAAAKLISNLEPRPGRIFQPDDTRYITPDIYIKKVNGEYVASLNDDGLPKLRISRYYKQELQRKRDAKEHDAVKDYIQDKLRGAMWLIRSIHQRQSTIVKVTESIIKFQHDFFEEGVEHLKPLVLRDVAADINMHESTVSRVTTNKYVHTPRGTFELKFFFNSSITKEDGDDLASEAVKAKIREILTTEDPKSPHSDAKIVEILAEENIVIARRTVAKYREMMGVLSSSKRKQVF